MKKYLISITLQEGTRAIQLDERCTVLEEEVRKSHLGRYLALLLEITVVTFRLHFTYYFVMACHLKP